MSTLTCYIAIHEGLGGTLDLCSNDKLAAGQSICTKARPVNQTLDDLSRWVRGRCQRLAQAQTWLAQLNAQEADAANQELDPDKLFEPDSASDHVSPRC